MSATEATSFDFKILNDLVRSRLKERVRLPYVLDSTGQEMVLAANAELNADYVAEHDCQRPNIFFEDLFSWIKEGSKKEIKVALDVCCGTGFLAKELVKRGVAEFSYAVDINPDAIAALEKTIREKNMDKVKAVRADFTSLTGHEIGKVDLIIGNSFLHHLPDNQEFLIKCRSLLEQGGTVLLVHEPGVYAGFLQNPVSFFLRFFRRKRGEMLTDIWQYSPERLNELFHKCGFSNVEIRGHGPLSTLVAFFFITFWTRVLRRGFPFFSSSFIYRLKLWERRYLPFVPLSWSSGFAVKATV